MCAQLGHILSFGSWTQPFGEHCRISKFRRANIQLNSKVLQFNLNCSRRKLFFDISVRCTDSSAERNIVWRIACRCSYSRMFYPHSTVNFEFSCETLETFPNYQSSELFPDFEAFRTSWNARNWDNGILKRILSAENFTHNLYSRYFLYSGPRVSRPNAIRLVHGI